MDYLIDFFWLYPMEIILVVILFFYIPIIITLVRKKSFGNYSRRSFISFTVYCVIYIFFRLIPLLLNKPLF